jgi:hypothetical protein
MSLGEVECPFEPDASVSRDTDARQIGRAERWFSGRFT